MPCVIPHLHHLSAHLASYCLQAELLFLFCCSALVDRLSGQAPAIQIPKSDFQSLWMGLQDESLSYKGLTLPFTPCVLPFRTSPQ